jgi:hypothetical protein
LEKEFGSDTPKWISTFPGSPMECDARSIIGLIANPILNTKYVPILYPELLIPK